MNELDLQFPELNECGEYCRDCSESCLHESAIAAGFSHDLDELCKKYAIDDSIKHALMNIIDDANMNSDKAVGNDQVGGLNNIVNGWSSGTVKSLDNIVNTWAIDQRDKQVLRNDLEAIIDGWDASHDRKELGNSINDIVNAWAVSPKDKRELEMDLDDLFPWADR